MAAPPTSQQNASHDSSIGEGSDISIGDLQVAAAESGVMATRPKHNLKRSFDEM